MGNPTLATPTRGATLDDVARLAKVSAITVSRVLNHPEKVSAKTAKRVRAAITKTGYVPNLLAGSLVSRRSRLVVVVIPTLANRAFVETVRQLALTLGEAGYQLMMCQIEGGAKSEAEMLDGILARRPDGLVLTTELRTEVARQRLINLSLPVVETWELNPAPIDCVVGFSHCKAGEAMAEYLVGRGYQRLAVLCSSDTRAAQRVLGCQQALNRQGREIAARCEALAPVSVADGRACLARLLESGYTFDAVICTIDLLAQGALYEAQARGLRVPEDFALFGFGDLDFAAQMFPALSTINIDAARIGELAARIVLERIAGAPRGSRIEDVGFQLVQRASA